MRPLQILGIVSALIVGFLLWSLALALSDGVGPLGKVRGTEFLLFFIPVVTFALPLAVIAFNREHVATATWLLATAPLLGFLDFVLAVLAMATLGDYSGDGPDGRRCTLNPCP